MHGVLAIHTVMEPNGHGEVQRIGGELLGAEGDRIGRVWRVRWGGSREGSIRRFSVVCKMRVIRYKVGDRARGSLPWRTNQPVAAEGVDAVEGGKAPTYQRTFEGRDSYGSSWHEIAGRRGGAAGGWGWGDDHDEGEEHGGISEEAGGRDASAGREDAGRRSGACSRALGH